MAEFVLVVRKVIETFADYLSRSSILDGGAGGKRRGERRNDAQQ
jgi:hypothetical protein